MFLILGSSAHTKDKRQIENMNEYEQILHGSCVHYSQFILLCVAIKINKNKTKQNKQKTHRGGKAAISSHLAIFTFTLWNVSFLYTYATATKVCGLCVCVNGKCAQVFFVVAIAIELNERKKVNFYEWKWQRRIFHSIDFDFVVATPNMSLVPDLLAMTLIGVFFCFILRFISFTNATKYVNTHINVWFRFYLKQPCNFAYELKWRGTHLS